MVGGKGDAGMTKRMVRLFPLFAMLLSFGCGGGGSADTTGGPAKATISFSLISTATLPFRISGLQIDGTLPAGVTVTTGDVNFPRKITEGLVAGSAVGATADWQSSVFGSYSAPNRVRLIIADGTSVKPGFGPGEMVRLTCTVAAGTSISESERLALESAITFKASGWDPTATTGTNPKPLNLFLSPKIAVTFSN